MQLATPHTLLRVAELLYPRTSEQSPLVIERSLGLRMFLISDLLVNCLYRYRVALRILHFYQWSAKIPLLCGFTIRLCVSLLTFTSTFKTPYMTSKVPVLRQSYTQFPCQFHTFLVYDTFSTKIVLLYGPRRSLYLCNQTHSPALFHAPYRGHRQTCVRLAQSLCGSSCGMASLNTVPRINVVA